MLGINEFKNSDWTIYPNPLSRELNVNDQLPGQTYAILNLQGLVVSKGTIDHSKVIQVAFLSNGNYS